MKHVAVILAGAGEGRGSEEGQGPVGKGEGLQPVSFARACKRWAL